jgi:hypothetical protein
VSESHQRKIPAKGKQGQTYKPSIANTPSDDTPGITLGTNGERKDLCRVQPWNREPRRTECESEDEDHASGGDTVSSGGSSVSRGIGIKT